MTTQFQINDTSLESQWRAIILFGNNSATYKFAFAKSLLGLIEKEKTKLSLEELAIREEERKRKLEERNRPK